MAGEIQLSPWQQMRLSAMYMQQQQAQQQARQQAGGVLYGMYGQGQQQPGAMPPPPPQQQPAPPPGAMSPGGGNPQVMGGQPQQPPRTPFGPSMQQGMPQGGGMPPPPMAAAGGAPGGAAAPRPGVPPVQPFRALPSAPAANDTGGGSVPPPPAQPAAPGAGGDQPGQRPFNLKNIIGSLKASGVPPEKAMDMLDALGPAMTSENKAELDYFKAQNAALKAANEIYIKTLNAATAGRRVDVADRAENRRDRQGDENIQIKREREQRLRVQAEKAGGKLTGSEFLYPNGPDGKPDTTQPPIGLRGKTANGRILNFDAQGNQVNQQPGQPAPKAGAGKDNVRTNIVKSGVTNAIARLNEIDKLGDVSTSSFFGQHGSNPLTRGAYGAAKGMQSKGQQDADAKWASMIDEAIPVFTGGLRGSDAFRRFLIEQAPGPGDKPETIREKKRLFRQNIEGTSKAFFNKYSSDPSFWGPGVKSEEVKGGGDAAPQQGGGEWKVEKVGG